MADEEPDKMQDFRRRAEASYHDVHYDERPCDHCGTLYRGPAVYCSLYCALADAT